MTASWLQSTGAGDDVLEVTAPGMVLEVTASRLRMLVERGELAVFGEHTPAVLQAFDLYRLAHEPAHAKASEDAVRAQLAERRAQDARRRELEAELGIKP